MSKPKVYETRDGERWVEAPFPVWDRAGDHEREILMVGKPGGDDRTSMFVVTVEAWNRLDGN